MERLPIVIAVHSSSAFREQPMFFKVMDSNLVTWNVEQVVTYVGSAVCQMAAHWCKLNRIKFSALLPTPSEVPREDRRRRHERMVAEGVSAILFFDIPDHFNEMAQIIETKAPNLHMFLVYTRHQTIRYEVYKAGMPRPVRAMVDDLVSTREVIRARKGPQPKLTDAQRRVNAMIAKEKASGKIQLDLMVAKRSEKKNRRNRNMPKIDSYYSRRHMLG